MFSLISDTYEFAICTRFPYSKSRVRPLTLALVALASRWEGLQFIVLCTCACHEEKGDARSAGNSISSVTNWQSHDEGDNPPYDPY